MKTSAVVQGLKSWASALHPQLPLSRKESHRLLNALTSSFRRQLDEVHPSHSKHDAEQHVNEATPRTGPIRGGSRLSSAAFADEHLASVLANPLLARGKSSVPSPSDSQAPKPPDHATALVELQRNPAQDPIELLEVYQEQGHATIPIAVACLETFHKSINALPQPNRKAAVAQTAVGKRTLLWIWQNKIYEDERFVEDKRLAQLVVSLVVEEGLEQYLWDWLTLDMALVGANALPKSEWSAKSPRQSDRWKGIVVRNIIVAKMRSNKSLDAALEAFFRALELPRAVATPLASSCAAIHRMVRQNHAVRHATSVELYDRFITEMRAERFTKANKLVAEYQVCWLYLLHPKTPSPDPALALLRRVFHPTEQLPDWQIMRTYFTKAETPSERQRLHTFFLETVVQLEDAERDADAAWVVAISKDVMPHLADDVEQYVRERRNENTKWRRALQTTYVEPIGQRKSARLPMPSFAV